MKFQKVAVMGAGTMGGGIAQWLAQVGVEVWLSDISSKAREIAGEKIKRSWQKLQTKGVFSAEEIDRFGANLHIESMPVPADCDLVIEAIVEDLDIKVEVFKELEKGLQKSCILASNTSSIPIDRMARELLPSSRQRFVGLHFFNPAPIMKLVEIVMGHWSDPSLCESLSEWLKERGKFPVICRDAPGFIVNRVVRNFYGEPLRIAGVHNRERLRQIDQVMRQVGGMKMGPFELMDLIGIDVNYAVTCSLWESF